MFNHVDKKYFFRNSEHINNVLLPLAQSNGNC